MANNDFKVLILGGGITGLCAANLLAKHYLPKNVLLLEGSAALGGTARTEPLRGFLCDLGPNGYLDREPLMKRWVLDLGIAPRIVKAEAAAARRFILKDGKLREVKPPPALFSSSILSVAGRMRLAAEPMVPRRKEEVPETIWEFAARRAGPEAADLLVSPMVTGIFGGDAKQLSMEHCFPKVAQGEREHGSVFKTFSSGDGMGTPKDMSGVLTTFDQGMGVLAETAAAKLGNVAQMNERVTGIEYRDRRYIVSTHHGAKYTANAVVSALPAHAAADACMDLEKSVASALGQIPYAPMVVFVAGYRREMIGHDLKGFGFLVPHGEKVRALGCIWTSSIFPHEAPPGAALLRVMYGGAQDPEAFKLSDRDLLEQFMRDMKPLLDLKGMPEFVRIYRLQRAIPQYTMDHAKRLRGIEQAEFHFKGLVFAGNSYRGVGLNDCIVSAHRALTKVSELVPN